MSDLLVGKTDYPPGNAGIAPAHEEARGMTPQQRSGALRLPGGDRVVDGAIDVAVLLEPCAGAGRQTSDRIGFAHLELRAKNITHEPAIARDLALIKVAATGEARTHVMQLVDVYRARIVDVSPESLVIETTGTEDKIDSLLEVLRPYGVVEMVRTGRVSMARRIHGAEKRGPLPHAASPTESRGDVSHGSV